MIGCTGQGNDIYVFIEQQELSSLIHTKVFGIYLNSNQTRTHGTLELSISEESCRKKMEQTLANRTKIGEITEKLEIIIRDQVYQKLITQGKYEDHQGFRHINLLTTDTLDGLYHRMYEDLKQNLHP